MNSKNGKEWGLIKRMIDSLNLYLNIKAFLSRQSKLPDLFLMSFDEKIILSLGRHKEDQSIALLFLNEEEQKIFLGKQFILHILESAQNILGLFGE